MSVTDPFRKVLKSQKELLSDLEKEINSLETSDFVTENQKLLKDLEKIKENFTKEKEVNQSLSVENKQLKNALFEQIYTEKMSLLNNSKKRVDLYFQSKTEIGLNNLKEFEKKALEQINAMTETLKKNRISAQDEIFNQLDDLKDKINKKVTLAQSELAASSGAFSKNQQAEFAELEKDQVTEYEIKGVLKKNNIESWIGLNMLSKIGIIFLIIAVIALANYGYRALPNELKGAVIFAIGAILLGIGEWLNRKIPNIFSIALTSGGIAILYVATSLSYLTLEIIPIEIALILCVLITILAFILAIRYNAETIAIFAMIGGYLPVVTLTSPDMPPYIIMGYFFLLNLLLLLIATKKKWIVSTFVGFILNIAAVIFIYNLQIVDKSYKLPYSSEDLITVLVTLSYFLLVFLIYTLIPMVSTYSKKSRFRNSDIILITANTYISAVVLYFSFANTGLEDYRGILAVAFALIYLLLGWWMERKMPEEKLMNKLFYLTGFAFVILFIPFQFGSNWLTLGWLIEGVVLATYGILQEERSIKWGGLVIYCLCLISFIVIDFARELLYYGSTNTLFTVKYFSVTLGTLFILTALAIKKTMQGILTKTFKYFAIINLWIFLIYILFEKGYPIIQDIRWFSPDYLIYAASIAVTFLLAYFTPRIKSLADNGMKIISMIMYIAGIIALFVLNNDSPVSFLAATTPFSIKIAGTAILILISLLSVLAMREVAMGFVVDRHAAIEWYPILISFYAVIILTQNLITQYGLEFQSLTISLIYIVTALLWIIYGFLKRYAYIRRFGLGLSILATAKLVFLDLSGLSPAGRIISYFAFGIFLLGISLVYQYFNKRLELHAEVIPDEKKDLD